MRILVYKDTAINTNQYDKWQREYRAFWEQFDISPELTTEKEDFSFYPTEKDGDGDLRPAYDFVLNLVEKAEESGEDAYDHIFIFIPKSRWRSGGDLFRELVGNPKAKGIWGTNFSYVYGNAHVHYCRWDSKNMANTFGTAYHEQMHSFDALTKVEANVDLNRFLGVSWDRDVVHGAHPDYEYIRWKDNAFILPKIAPHLKAAYRARKERHLAHLRNKVTLLQRVVQLMRLVRKLRNQKDGVAKLRE